MSVLSFFKLLPEFKNVKPWAGFYTPGLYLELFDTPAEVILRDYTPGLYSVFHSDLKLSLISPGLSNGLINGGVYIRGSLLPE